MAKPQTVLVTGITGFIGAALARRLIAEGVQVFGLVRPTSRRERLADLREVELLELPEFCRETLASVLAQVKPDVVINLAAAGVAEGDRDPGPMFQSNVQLVLDLIQAIAGTAPATLIQAGSCSEYGATPTAGPIAEAAPLQPLSFYGATKAAATLLAQSLARQVGVDLISLRLFGVFGPGEGPRRLAPYIIRGMQRGEPVNLTVGTQIRDLLFIDDTIDAFWAAACQREMLRDKQPFNVCSGQPVTVREVGQILAELMQRSPAQLRWGSKPSRTNEPERIVGSNSRFRLATGWLPRTSLREGLQRTIDYYVDHETPANPLAAA